MGKKRYPTGPLRRYFDQVSNLLEFKEDKRELFSSLSLREIEVLTLLAEGKNNPAIANDLNISRTTVQNHRARIRAKLNINKQAEIVKYALAFDLIQF